MPRVPSAGRFTCSLASCDDKPFESNSALHRHYRSQHLTKRAHACTWPDCNSTFGNSHGLKVHMNTHTGEKPNECKTCGKCFGDPSSCSRHVLETHIMTGGYTCPSKGCRTSIKRKGAFKLHVLKKHGITVTDASLYAPQSYDPVPARSRRRHGSMIRNERNPSSSLSRIFQPTPTIIADEVNPIITLPRCMPIHENSSTYDPSSLNFYDMSAYLQFPVMGPQSPSSSYSSLPSYPSSNPPTQHTSPYPGSSPYTPTSTEHSTALDDFQSCSTERLMREMLASPGNYFTLDLPLEHHSSQYWATMPLDAPYQF